MSENAPAVSNQQNINSSTKTAASLAFQGEQEGKEKVEENDSKPPAAKKARVIDANSSRSFLLECITPEIMQNVYSFLNLKDALVVRQTCSTLNQGTDAFRYCQLISGCPRDIHFLNGCFAPSGMHNLRAILSNKSLGTAANFISILTKHSKTDNGEALSILLEDGRPQVSIRDLHQALKNDYSRMALVLKEYKDIKPEIQMCHSCSDEIGAYFCSNDAACVSEREREQNESDSDGKELYFCHPCIMANEARCGECGFHICPACVESLAFDQCNKCGRSFCIERSCKIRVCRECGVHVCNDCRVSAYFNGALGREIIACCDECAYQT